MQASPWMSLLDVLIYCSLKPLGLIHQCLRKNSLKFFLKLFLRAVGEWGPVLAKRPALISSLLSFCTNHSGALRAGRSCFLHLCYGNSLLCSLLWLFYIIFYLEGKCFGFSWCWVFFFYYPLCHFLLDKHLKLPFFMCSFHVKRPHAAILTPWKSRSWISRTFLARYRTNHIKIEIKSFCFRVGLDICLCWIISHHENKTVQTSPYIFGYDTW